MAKLVSTWYVNSLGQRVEGTISDVSMCPVGLDVDTVAAMGEHPSGVNVMSKVVDRDFAAALKNGTRVRVTYETIDGVPQVAAVAKVDEPKVAEPTVAEPAKVG